MGAAEPPRCRGRGARPIAAGLRAIGAVAVVILGNYLVGLAWDTATGSGTEGPTAARIRMVPHDQPIVPTPEALAATTLDPRAVTPPMDDVAWSEDYFREMALTGRHYWPYQFDRVADFRGRFFTFSDGVRRSYQPAGEPAAPIVAFFGGSAMWGEGQRDLGTIPSVVARLAEADGLPVRVENRGVRGDTLWPEVLQFEQRTAAEDGRPALAVFYDGWNECASVDKPGVEPGQPFEFAVDQTRAVLVPEVTAEGAWKTYQRHSAVHKVIDRVGDLFEGVAGAAEPATEPVTSPTVPATPVDHCVAVYQRARDLARDLGGARDVGTAFFWQPLDRGRTYEAVHWEAAAAVGPPTVDLTDVVPPGEVPESYIDLGHMTERGAEIVGAAMWEHLRPRVEAWYRDHG